MDSITDCENNITEKESQYETENLDGDGDIHLIRRNVFKNQKSVSSSDEQEQLYDNKHKNDCKQHKRVKTKRNKTRQKFVNLINSRNKSLETHDKKELGKNCDKFETNTIDNAYLNDEVRI